MSRLSNLWEVVPERASGAFRYRPTEGCLQDLARRSDGENEDIWIERESSEGWDEEEGSTYDRPVSFNAFLHGYVQEQIRCWPLADDVENVRLYFITSDDRELELLQERERGACIFSFVRPGDEHTLSCLSRPSQVSARRAKEHPFIPTANLSLHTHELICAHTHTGTRTLKHLGPAEIVEHRMTAGSGDRFRVATRMRSVFLCVREVW